MLSHYLIKDYYYKFFDKKPPLTRQCFYKVKKGKQIIFIHIPKTAGTSIGRALQLAPPHRSFGIRKHVSADMAFEMVGSGIWENAIKFACVRNPWAKLYSHFKFKKKHGLLKGEKIGMSFNEWGISVLDRDDLKMVRSQCDWIRVSKGQSELDLIIRFEDFQNGIQQLNQLLGFELNVPHLLKSKYTKPYQEVYSDELRKLVGDKYEEDVVRFGYSF